MTNQFRGFSEPHSTIPLLLPCQLPKQGRVYEAAEAFFVVLLEWAKASADYFICSYKIVKVAFIHQLHHATAKLTFPKRTHIFQDLQRNMKNFEKKSIS
jgi:hypothetical protein